MNGLMVLALPFVTGSSLRHLAIVCTEHIAASGSRAQKSRHLRVGDLLAQQAEAQGGIVCRLEVCQRLFGSKEVLQAGSIFCSKVCGEGQGAAQLGPTQGHQEEPW